jgi:hypothetical protein
MPRSVGRAFKKASPLRPTQPPCTGFQSLMPARASAARHHLAFAETDGERADVPRELSTMFGTRGSQSPSAFNDPAIESPKHAWGVNAASILACPVDESWRGLVLDRPPQTRLGGYTLKRRGCRDAFSFPPEQEPRSRSWKQYRIVRLKRSKRTACWQKVWCRRKALLPTVPFEYTSENG